MINMELQPPKTAKKILVSLSRRLIFSKCPLFKCASFDPIKMIRIYPSGLESPKEELQTAFHCLVMQLDYDPSNPAMFYGIDHPLQDQEFRSFHIYLYKIRHSPYRPVVG